MTVGLTRTNRFPTLIHERQRLDWQLDLRKPTAFQPSYLKAQGWNDGWIDENQPFSNPHTWAATVGLTVGFAKNNRVPTFVYLSRRLEWRLICENQLRSNFRILKSTVGMTVCFAKTNCVPTLGYWSPWLEWRLVLRKPSPFQLLYIIAHGWNDGWFCENQPRSNLRILKPMVGMAVGFAKTNHVPTFVYHSLWLECRLVFRKPTPFQLSYLKVHGWNDRCFCENQPRSNLCTLKHMVGMTVGLTKTNRFPTLIHER